MKKGSDKEVLVSIIIPVYNAEQYLKICLESILQQLSDKEKIEIILVDDGSTDGSSMICDEYKTSKYVRVYHKKNEGVSCARNFGISVAIGEYIFFCDADDYFRPGAIKTIIYELKNCAADYYLFPIIKEKSNGEQIQQHYFFEGQCVSIKKACEVFFVDGNNGPWSKLFSRKIIVDNDLLFDVKLKIHEDVIFCMKYLEHCSNVKYCIKPIYFYRFNSCGAIGKHKIEYLSNYSTVYYLWKEFLISNDQEDKIKRLNSEFLRKMLTTCGKLYKNGISKAELNIELQSNHLYNDLINLSFNSWKDKIQQLLLKHNFFSIVAIKVR